MGGEWVDDSDLALAPFYSPPCFPISQWGLCKLFEGKEQKASNLWVGGCQSFDLLSCPYLLRGLGGWLILETKTRESYPMPSSTGTLQRCASLWDATAEEEGMPVSVDWASLLSLFLRLSFKYFGNSALYYESDSTNSFEVGWMTKMKLKALAVVQWYSTCPVYIRPWIPLPTMLKQQTHTNHR